MLSSPSKTRSSGVKNPATPGASMAQRVESIKPAQQYYFLQNPVFAQILEQESHKKRTSQQSNTIEQKDGAFWHDLLTMCMPADYSDLLSQFPYEQHLKEQIERLFTDIHLYRLQQLYQRFLKTPSQTQGIQESFDTINDRLDRVKNRINTLV